VKLSQLPKPIETNLDQWLKNYPAFHSLGNTEFKNKSIAQALGVARRHKDDLKRICSLAANC
jgi:hypothetical protein